MARHIPLPCCPEGSRDKSDWRTMIHVFVADAHAVVREGVKRVLSATTDMCVSGEANNTQEMLVHVVRYPSHVVLLDSLLPCPNGLGVLQTLQHIQPDYRGHVRSAANVP